MKLLAFETATEACSVALWIDGDVRERFELAPRRHAELSLPWAEQLLAEAGIAKSQLDAIAVGRGPGAFTGVRLAIAIAQGIALALDRPVVPVSTLAALAMQSPGERILAAIDARMGEVYLGGVRSAMATAWSRSARKPSAQPDAVPLPDGRRLAWRRHRFRGGRRRACRRAWARSCAGRCQRPCRTPAMSRAWRRSRSRAARRWRRNASSRPTCATTSR